MGFVRRLVVKKAAKFAVYELIIISVKSHQHSTNMRTEQLLGLKSIPLFLYTFLLLILNLLKLMIYF